MRISLRALLLALTNDCVFVGRAEEWPEEDVARVTVTKTLEGRGLKAGDRVHLRLGDYRRRGTSANPWSNETVFFTTSPWPAGECEPGKLPSMRLAHVQPVGQVAAI
jgi:hypothetical protein